MRNPWLSVIHAVTPFISVKARWKVKKGGAGLETQTCHFFIPFLFAQKAGQVVTVRPKHVALKKKNVVKPHYLEPATFLLLTSSTFSPLAASVVAAGPRPKAGDQSRSPSTPAARRPPPPEQSG